MKEKYQSNARLFLIYGILIITVLKTTGQTTLPDVLSKGTLKEQMNYIGERTRIYENYRAIREDMFQKINGNISDTLSATNQKITGLINLTYSLNQTIDSLNVILETAKASLKEITRTKNSIRVLGLEINKVTYNSIMWLIVAGLIGILAIGFLAFKRNLSVASTNKKELAGLKEEFEAYRKTSREAREKMSMDHFKEIQKLKGG